MNFMNRKLFKGRAARDKLNKMGGIMASSQPLMNTVQNFQLGGNVQTQMNRRNVGVGIPSIAAPTNIGARSGAPLYARVGSAPKLPYATQIMDFLGDTFGPETAEERQQRVSNARAIRTAITPPEDAQIRQSSALGDFIFPETEVEPEFETPSRTPSPVGRRMDPNDPRIDAMIDNTTGPGVSGETIEDFPLGGRRITDPAEIQSLLESPEGRAQREVEPEFQSAMSISEQADTATGKTKTATQVAKIQTGTTAEKKEATETLGQQLIRQVEDGNFDQAEDTIAEAYGLTEDEVERKTEDEIAKMQGIISKVLGVDPEKYKQDRGLALAMAGFKFAQTGDIGEAGAQFTKEIARLRQADQARQDKVDSLAISTVLGREDKESDRKFARDMKRIDQAHDFRKIGKMQSFDLKKLGAEIDFKTYINDTNNALKLNLKNKDIDIVNARLQADMDNLITRLDRQEEIAKDDRSSRENIAAANNEAANIRAEMSGLGDATKLAMIEGKQRGLTGTKLTDFISTRSKDLATTDVLTGPDSLRRLITVTAPKIMDEEGVPFGEATQKIIDAITSTPELQAIYGTDLEQLGITGSQASGGPKVGDVITQGTARFKILEVGPDGKPTRTEDL